MGQPLPIAVSCGDPSGIGLEVIAGAWQALGRDVPFFVIADPKHVPAGVPVSVVQEPTTLRTDALTVLRHEFANPARPGAPDPANAASVVSAIERGVTLALNNRASALCTAPISKKELVDHAGFTHPGHTEFLATLSGAPMPVMMLASDELKVVPATIHIPLQQVPKALTAQKLEDTLRITHDAMLRDFGLPAPRLAVSGLNPHAGEGGLLGAEDDALIAPVCAALRAEGMQISGPLPADTMFHEAARAKYDVAICMYHDQALIPIKTLAFDTGVNVTLGLPFIRTSPDHGTAFDIAGQNVANPTSMIEALKLAWSMAKARAM